MAGGEANCLVCGERIAYWEEAQKVTCYVCGKMETGHCVCADGHYVCDMCHREAGVNWAMEYCMDTNSHNPIEIAIAIMENQSIYPNGPEHHTLIGASLMAAYANAGGEVDLEKALVELRERSLQVPGGVCGFWGTCGSVTSAGQFYSIVSGSTPMKRDAWARTQRLTSRALARLADLGGPRCCKRTGFSTILETVDFVAETMGVQMETPEEVVCTFSERNRECLRGRCPFYRG